MCDSHALLALAVSLARQAEEIISCASERTVIATKSSTTDAVTATDVAVESFIRDELGKLRPADGVLGEEHGLQAGTSGVTWVVDPIDGTVNFLYGLGEYAVSIAAVTGPPNPAQWQVQAGAVLSLPSQRMWTAARGQGAWRDGVQLSVPPPKPLAESLVGTGFGYQVARRTLQGKVLAGVLPACRDIRRLGVASVDMCLVAEGGLDLFYERGLNHWDMAAASIIAQEAGAKVVGLHNEPAGNTMTVVGHGQALSELVALLEAQGADDIEI